MFFIPNRLYIVGKEIHVSFNVAVIPPDNTVTSANLCIPLPERNSPLQMKVTGIASGWDENWIQYWKPEYDTKSETFDVAPESPEGIVPVTHVMNDWRFRSLENHGLYISLVTEEELDISGEKPPYLLVRMD